jgi:hypothetical protein
MRKKIAVGVVLVAVVLAVAVVVCNRMEPAEPPLKLGMQYAEAMAAMENDSWERDASESIGPGFTSAPNWAGGRRRVEIDMEWHHTTVRGWEVKALPRTRPRWLDRALKAVGW